MLNRKQSIIAGCVILVILLLTVFLTVVGTMQKSDEDMLVNNSNNDATTEGNDEGLLDEKSNEDAATVENEEDLLVDNNTDNATGVENDEKKPDVKEVIDKDNNDISEATEEKNDSRLGNEQESQDKLVEEEKDKVAVGDKDKLAVGDKDKLAEDNNVIPAEDVNKDEQAVENSLSKDEILTLLCSTDWHEISKYTYLAIKFSEDGTFNQWDTVGNPSMKGNFSIDTENMQITLDCTNDVDYDPPFDLPKLSVCSFYFTKAGDLCIEYQKDKLLFRKDKNVEADLDLKGYIWNAKSASDGSDVRGLKLDLGNYFALFNKDKIYFASEIYSIGTITDYITVNWSSYGNDNGQYEFTYSILPYVDLGFWDLSDKTLAVEDATDTFEEDMKLQFSYKFKNDILELEFDGVTITFTRGEASVEEDEVIYRKLI